MKTLVTGGAGFIGSHIQDRLVELGHKVAVVDNLRSGKKDNLNPKSKFFEVDIRKSEELIQVFEEFSPEAVFHLAAQNEVPYSMDHPLEDQDINIVGMINLLELCKKKKPKFIYSNTGGALYGEVSEEDLPVKEDFIVTKPTSFYGVSKMSGEFYLRLYGNLYQLPWVSLRYANVYGPRQDGNKEAGIVAVFTSKLLNKEQPKINGDGKHTRDYVYVEDVVDANIKALDFKENDAFNISTGLRTSNLEVFNAIEEVLNTGIQVSFGPDRPGDPKHNCLSPDKAKQILGWEPKVSFKEGVKKTLNYYLKS